MLIAEQPTAALPSDEEFFRRGGHARRAGACHRDVARIVCEPKPCVALAYCNYNCCFGSVAAPYVLPCAPCTWCFPLKVWDIACLCCKTPQQRCDSGRYWGQRIGDAAFAAVPTLWPYEDDPYAGRDGPWCGANPNRFSSWVESVFDLLTAVRCLAPAAVRLNKAAFPKAAWAPAARSVGFHDRQMDDGRDFGGVWVYPSSYNELPTPPNAKDASGAPLPTNVKAGEPGSRILVWAHGSAFALTQSLDFLWLVGQFLADATGQVVLIPEYGLTSSRVFPDQLDGFARTYAKLVEAYGADNIIVAGDSAGGNLALEVALKSNLPPPSAVALFSPWVDMSDAAATTDSMKANRPSMGGLKRWGRADYLPSPVGILVCSAAYATADARATDPDVSPLLAPDASLRRLAGKTKVFCTWGSDEELRDSNEAVSRRLAASGVDVTTFVGERMPHDAPVFAPLIYLTGCGCFGLGDYADFEPSKAWVEFFAWLRTIKGWEAAAAPRGWDGAPSAGK